MSYSLIIFTKMNMQNNDKIKFIKRRNIMSFDIKIKKEKNIFASGVVGAGKSKYFFRSFMKYLFLIIYSELFM